jgi:hypothetical protein
MNTAATPRNPQNNRDAWLQMWKTTTLKEHSQQQQTAGTPDLIINYPRKCCAKHVKYVVLYMHVRKKE